MNRRSPLLAGLSAVTIALPFAGCGSGSPTAPPTANPNATGAAQASGAISSPGGGQSSAALPSIPVVLPSGSFALPSGSFVIPSFSFPSEDKELEARLPIAINGVTLTKYSWKGADFFKTGNPSSQNLQNLLTALGKSPADLSIAFASDPTGGLGTTIGAFKVSVADGNALLTGFLNAAKNETPADTFSQTSAGGKNVTQITNP